MSKGVDFRFNIALRVENAFARDAIHLSEDLSKKGETFFVLDDKDFIPHITVFQGQIPEEYKDHLLRGFDTLGGCFVGGDLSYTKVSTVKGFVGLSVDQPQWLKDLHRQALVLIASECEIQPQEKFLPGGEEFDEGLLPNVEKYGSPFAGDAYDPHVTLTRFKKEDVVEKNIKALKVPNTKLTIKKIGLYEMGDHGTCRKVIKEVSV